MAAFLAATMTDPERIEEWIEGALPPKLDEPGAGGEAGAEASAPAFSFVPGALIDDFRLECLIASGGMGQVWEASQISIPRPVALKVISPGRADAKGLAYFEREARAGGRLVHPGIVGVYGWGQSQGVHWIAQEFVPGGRTLRDFIEEARGHSGLGPDYYRRVVGLVLRIAEALQVAHDAGVIHRDVKPANVLLSSGDEPKLADFGLAQVANDRDLSITGDPIGTYRYMSPEQAEGKRRSLDLRTDVFSLGVVLYEMLALQRPFDGDTSRQIMTKIVHEEPEPLRRIRSQIPSDLALVCGKALNKSPERRYRSMEMLAQDLRRFLNDEPVLAKPPSLVYRAWKLVRRRRRVFVPSLVGGVVAAMLVGFSAWNQLWVPSYVATLAREAREESRAHADREQHQKEMLLGFLTDVIALADPQVSLDQKPTLALLLSSAGTRVDQALADDPDGRALVYTALGRALESHGDLRDAGLYLRRAADLIEESPNSSLEQRYETTRLLSRVYGDSDSRDAQEMRESAHILALRLLEQRSPELADCLRLFSSDANDLNRERAALERARTLARECLAPGHADWQLLADSFEHIALFLCTKDLQLESDLLASALAIRRGLLAPSHPEIAHCLRMFVWVLNKHGQYNYAEVGISEAIDIYKGVLPEEHWVIAVAESMRGEALSGTGSYHEAEVLLLEADARIIAARGRASQAGVDSACRLTRHYGRRHNDKKAAEYRNELIYGLAYARNLRWAAVPRRVALENHPKLSLAVQDLYLSGEVDRTSEIAHLLNAWSIPADSDLSLVLAKLLSSTFRADPTSNDPDVLERLYAHLLGVLEPQSELFPREVEDLWRSRAELAEAQGQLTGAAECLEAALRISRMSAHGLSHRRLTLKHELADNLVQRGFEREAVASLQEAWEACVEELGEAHPLSQYALVCLATIFDELDASERIEPFVQRHLRAILDQQGCWNALECAWVAIRSAGLSGDTYELARRVCAEEYGRDRMHEIASTYLAIAEIRTGHEQRGLRRIEETRVVDVRVDALGTIFRAVALLQLGNTQAARSLLDQLDPLETPLDSEQVRILEEAYAALGD